MLEDKALSKIITWSSSQNSVMIMSEEALGKILPNYGFKTNNFAAFQRQLNYYGFRKASTSRNPTEYSHGSFYRGSKSLKDIKKRTSKKQSTVPESIVEVREEIPASSHVLPTQMVDLTSEDPLVNENRLLKEEIIRLRAQNQSHQNTIKDISTQLEMNKKETEILKNIVDNLTQQLENQKNNSFELTFNQEQTNQNIISFDIPQEPIQSQQVEDSYVPNDITATHEQVHFVLENLDQVVEGEPQISIPIDIPDELVQTHGQVVIETTEYIPPQYETPSEFCLLLDPEMETLMNEILNECPSYSFES